MTDPFLMIGPCLVAIGMFGFLTRRNLILMFLSLELMLAGASLNFIAFGRIHGDFGGQAFALFILVVAACEAALALSLIVTLVRSRGTLDARAWGQLREYLTEPTVEQKRSIPAFDKISETTSEYENLPKLTPAGLDPLQRPVDSDFKLPDSPTKA